MRTPRVNVAPVHLVACQISTCRRERSEHVGKYGQYEDSHHCHARLDQRWVNERVVHDTLTLLIFDYARLRTAAIKFVEILALVLSRRSPVRVNAMSLNSVYLVR